MTTTTAPQMRTFADAEVRLAETLPGYESRPQQKALAQAVERVLASRQPAALLGEAGCGTGKSLAALIPAVLSGRRLVYSTATKALQDQIALKDVPFLLENLGKPFTAALLKGRSNYFCIAKANNLPDIEAKALLQAELEADDDHTGDRGDFAHQMSDVQWRDFSASAEECPGKKECPFGEVCFAEAAKKRAKQADVVIVNHALLFTDMKVRKATNNKANMMGDFDCVVIDEAHEIEEIATNSLGDELWEGRIRRLLTEVRNYAGEVYYEGRAEVTLAVEAALTAVWELLPEQVGTVVGLRYFLEHQDAFTALITSLHELAATIADDMEPRTEKQEAKRDLLMTRATNFAYKISEIMLADDGDMVRWIEQAEVRGEQVRYLKSAPLNVGPWLIENLWSKKIAVLVSATMSVGGDFTYITERLGLDAPETLIVGTPFDYATQAMIYVPGKEIPSPKERQAWLQVTPVIVQKLIGASKGGALVLCTSRESMNTLHRTLEPMLVRMGITVLKQGVGSNRENAARFAEDTHSVLFATKSFFTGVDFKGEACRMVIIDKLPFKSPADVVWNARCEDVNRKARRNVAFSKMSIPDMTLILEQAFGRLIRSMTDRGVVAILDSRLVSTGYGRGILGNLPDCPATTDLAKVEQFYAA